MTDPAEYPTRVWCSMRKGVFETTPPTDGQLAWEWQEFVLPADARLRQLEADLAATLAANAALVQRLDEAVSEERSRCMRIVSAARNGDIDTDFRTLLHFMESGDTMQFFAETHEYVHDSAVQDRIAVRAFLAGGAA